MTPPERPADADDPTDVALDQEMKLFGSVPAQWRITRPSGWGATLKVPPRPPEDSHVIRDAADSDVLISLDGRERACTRGAPAGMVGCRGPLGGAERGGG